MLVIKNLKYNLDGFELKIDHLDLSNQSVVAIMGPSGAGKTTLFQTLIGIHRPTNWTCLIQGKEVSQLRIEQRHLGVVFQKHELFPHMTAEENIRIIMKARGATSAEDEIRLQKYKTILKLDSCWSTLAERLSGGEAQRVSLLRAVMSCPQMLLLDEPFSSLDSELKDEARKLTAQLIDQLKLPTLLITHDLADARALGAYIIHLRNGQIVENMDAKI